MVIKTGRNATVTRGIYEMTPSQKELNSSKQAAAQGTRSNFLCPLYNFPATTTPSPFQYRGSSIIGTLITVILAIPGFIKNSK